MGHGLKHGIQLLVDFVILAGNTGYAKALETGA